MPWLLLLSLALWSAQAAAVNPATPFERLVMPGELVRAHAKLENDCGACHVRFKKGGQSERCRACHEKIDADLRAGTGFHGRDQAAKRLECRQCHTDHQGRDARIVLFDADAFDHRATDFPLAGAHRAAPCGACHEAGRPYRAAPHGCIDCHRDDDWHATWGAWRFDHDRTDFPLKGAHIEADCERCHANARYARTPKACHACHDLDDVHRGANGERCQDCHGQSQWRRPDFDHDRDTDWDDCALCHNATDWRLWTFDHDRQTDYPLEGAHRRLACGQCHRGPLDREVPRDCFGCHQGDDRHGGQQGTRCGDCHGPRAWPVEVRFDHDLTDFPLLGMHRVVPCEACHLSPTFDHDRQTDYPLTGAHRDLDCHACHTQPVDDEIHLETDCVACHEDDDAHNGGFGRDCGRCHLTRGWGEVKSP